MTSLKGRINEDVKAALRGGDRRRVGVLRLITAAIKQREVDERLVLDDAEVVAVLERMVKQRKEAIEHYRRAGRQDLLEQEQFELEVIGAYLPPQLSAAQIEAAIDETIAATGAQTVRDLGKVMGALKERLRGQAELGAVSARVREKLGG